ncbi:hypothetical protein APUTEX25_003799, partial [Auxenochlorella protothecoides]
ASMRTVEETFFDFSQRRKGILRALVQEVDKFYAACHPELDNLCLYGNPDGSWEVRLPCDEVPPELPEPALGINFARDGMDRRDWLSLIAVHSDSWLISMAYFNAARLDAEGRRLLFNEINSLPTCLEVVTGSAAPGSTTQAAAHISKRPAGVPQADPAPDTKRPAFHPAVSLAVALGQTANQGRPRQGPPPSSAAEESSGSEDAEEAEYEPCPNCGREFKDGDFWIFCDYCRRWFDGRCVGMTAQRAEASKTWKCPFCTKEA